MQIAKSLEDYRQERFMSIDEFVKLLDLAPRTYYRLLRRDPAVRPTTKRRVAEKLSVPPMCVAEFIPAPSEEQIARITGSIRRANQHGWIVGDPETGEPTDIIEHVEALSGDAEAVPA